MKKQVPIALFLTVMVALSGCVVQDQSATDGANASSGTDAGFDGGIEPIDRPKSIQVPDNPPLLNNSPSIANSYKRLYREIIDSVVSLRVGERQGSGFVYDESGHVITNQHVVNQANGTIYVKFSEGEFREAKVMGTDVYTDLAVLKVDGVPEYVDALPVAEEDPVQGELVAAIGTPLTYEGSITQGIVSGVNRRMVTANNFVIPDTVQTDAPINRGNSGGPLVTLNGVVVGVNRAKIGSNIGFAISPELVNKVVPKLIKDGNITHPYLGVKTQTVTPRVAKAQGMDKVRGVAVVEVVDDGPSSGILQGKTGKEKIDGLEVPVGGDVIVAIDGQRINSNEELARYLMTKKNPDETVEITVLRDGSRKDVKVTLGERPEPK